MFKQIMQFKKIILFFIILEILFASLIQIIQDKEFNLQIEKYNKHAEADYKQLYTSLNIHADTIFNEMINQEDVLTLFKEASNPDKLLQDKARKALYQLLLKHYQRLSHDTNLKQLHFHTKDNRSFLRMHKPDSYGDDLTLIRKSVNYVNQYKEPTQGFEVGRVHSGFRFVYPLFYENVYLGSVEASFAACSLHDNLKTNQYDVCVIVKKDEVFAKSQKDELDTYMSIRLSDIYLREQDIVSSQYMNDATIDSIKDEFAQKQASNKSFSIYTHENGGVLVSFVPIQNVNSNDYVAYVVFVRQEENMLMVSYIFLVMQTLLLIFLTSSLILSLNWTCFK